MPVLCPVLPSDPAPSARALYPSDPAAAAMPLMRAVAVAFGVPEPALNARSRGPADAAFARQCAMYLAHVALGLTYSDAGRLFGRDRTTAAHACRLVETRRDDPGLDQLLQSLEESFRPAAALKSAGEPRI